MKYLNSLLQRLKTDQRGVIAIVFILFLGVLLTGSLIAIDFVRHGTAQTRLQNALDTAVISAGRRLSQFIPTADESQQQRWENDAYGYFKANMPDDYLGARIGREQVDIKYLEDREGTGGRFLAGQRVQMQAKGSLPLLSVGYLDKASLDIQAANEVTRRTRNDLEVVLALDNTGSMNYSVERNSEAGRNERSRMSLLKEAAATLIDTVMEASAYSVENPDEGAFGAYIGLVPFTDNVKVGHLKAAKNWLNYPPEMNNYIDNIWSKSTNSGCIVEPDPPAGTNWTTGNPLPALPLTPNAGFKPMVAIREESINLASGSEYLIFDDRYPDAGFNVQSRDSSRNRLIKAVTNRAWPQGTPNAQNSPKSIKFYLLREPDYCTKSKTQFLTKETQSIQTAIQNMEAYGGTGVSTGLLWAWRMLSPEWRGSNGWGDPDLPRDPDPKLRKVIVLLSDGDNAPVVRRPYLGATNDTYTINFKKMACSSWWGCNPTETNTSFTARTTGAQCPINGLRSVSWNDESFAENCGISSNNYSPKTSIGYPHWPANGSDSFAGGAMTWTSFDAHLATVCDNISKDKENKISIYTLTLGAGVERDTSKQIMQQCASKTGGQYFDVTRSDQLADAFAQIAGALTELRLTK